MKRISISIFSVMVVAVLLSSCGANGNNPGRIYMPDMTYSQAQEAYAGYGAVDGNEISAKLPPKGTIPRGHALFHFQNNLEEYARAGAELTNPVEFNEENMQEGQRLFAIYCAPCHGGAGAGDGSIAKKINTLQPAAYWDETMVDLSDGEMFFSIHYGKGMMGSYASQLTQTERWKIIHYINFLQDEKTAESPAAEDGAEPTNG